MSRFTPTTLASATKTRPALARGLFAALVLAGAVLASGPTPAQAGPEANVQVVLKARPHLMGALANVYAEKKLGLSAAHMTLKNTTGKALRNYRVRFQLVDFSPDWSAWDRHAQVAPGQTVDSQYYPILDVNKVNKVIGVRWVYLKAEYQYQQADGQQVSDTETVRLQILGRNLVEYTDHAYDPKLPFAKNWELAPLVMASLVSAQDPVIHQLAGRICGRLGGSGAIYSQEETVKYMKALYDFMADYITYKSPDGDSVQSKCRQHVKFGRDVLTDRAGTCIELAILYASACEAMGLEPLTVLIPGHVFAGVKVHIKDKAGKDAIELRFVELTVIGKLTFEQASVDGLKKFEEWVLKKKECVVTDIKMMRTLGVNPFDLPAVEANWLAKVCPKKHDLNIRTRSNAVATPLVGTWKMVYRYEGQVITQVLKLNGDGTCKGIRKARSGQAIRFSGTYRYDGRTFNATITTGDSCRGSIQWINKDKFQFTEANGKVLCQRVG